MVHFENHAFGDNQQSTTYLRHNRCSMELLIILASDHYGTPLGQILDVRTPRLHQDHCLWI